jgi:hypothetical protein
VSDALGRGYYENGDTKIIAHAFGEQCQLRTIREELNRAHAQRVAPAVVRATSPVVQKLPRTGRQRSRWTQ